MNEHLQTSLRIAGDKRQTFSYSLLPIDSEPLGLTFGEWSIRWWRWLLSIPKHINPCFDSTGSYADISQTDEAVFFLCQTYEGSGILPHRSISVANGKRIFVPIINWISLLHVDGETEEELLENARRRMNVIGNLNCTINQVSIEGLHNFRVLSPFFDVTLPEDNIVGLPPGTRRAISDGYWIFIEPKSSKLEISTFGSCSAGITTIGVVYEICIAS